MTVQEFETRIWPFYLRLEREFINTLTYVEFSPDNFSTYSIEYEKQLLSIGSEIDILCKLLCAEIDSTQHPSKMDGYTSILSGYMNITSTKIRFCMNQQDYIPFDGWTIGNNPTWWKAYNKVKHERLLNENYKKGNLENVFHALAGLYLLNRLYYKKIKQTSLELSPNPHSEIFSVVGWNVCIPVGNGFYNVLHSNGGMGLLHE